VEDRLLPLKQTVRHLLDPRTTLLMRRPAKSKSRDDGAHASKRYAPVLAGNHIGDGIATLSLGSSQKQQIL
jgi:hypothetical protein